VVAAVGAGVSEVTVGQRVYVNPLISCGRCPACLAGRQNTCAAWRLLGMDRVNGAYAEFVAVPAMQVSDALLDYVQQIINHTRHSPRFTQGLSPRAGVAILRAAQAWAMMEGRRQVLPEDVQAILPPVVGHRLHGNADAVKGSFDAAKELIAGVPIP
jgi:NADPH:quinone reductase-like Zn-dependent oxidoreductase